MNDWMNRWTVERLNRKTKEESKRWKYEQMKNLNLKKWPNETMNKYTCFDHQSSFFFFRFYHIWKWETDFISQIVVHIGCLLLCRNVGCMTDWNVHPLQPCWTAWRTGREQLSFTLMVAAGFSLTHLMKSCYVYLFCRRLDWPRAVDKWEIGLSYLVDPSLGRKRNKKKTRCSDSCYIEPWKSHESVFFSISRSKPCYYLYKRIEEFRSNNHKCHLSSSCQTR